MVSPDASGCQRAGDLRYGLTVPTDTFEKMRALALDGIVLPPTAPPKPLRKRRNDGAPPPVDGSLPPPAREPMPHLLRAGAELEWRRAAHAWVPSLERIVARGVVAVTVRDRDVAAVMPNGTQRARGLPLPWVAVVVAILTGRELPAVRRALRAGVRHFTPERERATDG